jgi:hypothetical protein
VKALYKLAIASAALAPAKMFACAACYANGATIDDPMTHGMNWAILTLGLMVGTVLVTFLAYFIYIMRRSEMLEAAAQQNRAAQRSQAKTPATAAPAPAGRSPITIDAPEFAKV